MGVLADAVLSRGGCAHGVITERLQAKGHIHPNLTDSEVVLTMRTRKERMAELADAWTLNQLGELDKPAGLLNINGFFEPFMAFVDQMIKEAFLPPSRSAVFPSSVWGTQQEPNLPHRPSVPLTIPAC
jgi:predicted Rossmann-fold nucleotide-binding protein